MKTVRKEDVLNISLTNDPVYSSEYYKACEFLIKQLLLKEQIRKNLFLPLKTPDYDMGEKDIATIKLYGGLIASSNWNAGDYSPSVDEKILNATSYLTYRVVIQKENLKDIWDDRPQYVDFT